MNLKHPNKKSLLSRYGSRSKQHRFMWGAFLTFVSLVVFLSIHEKQMFVAHVTKPPTHAPKLAAAVENVYEPSKNVENTRTTRVEEIDFPFIRPKTILKSTRHKLYCMVPTVYHPHRFEKLRAVAETWGKRCDVIKFFIDPPTNGEVFPDVFVSDNMTVPMIQVPLQRVNDVQASDKKYPNKSCTLNGRRLACRHIWEKVWRSWVWVAENDLETADWFFKVDDDSFIFPEFIRYFLEVFGWDAKDTYYFGHVSELASTPFVNGAVVGLSKGTLGKVAEKYRQMPREYGDRSKFKHNRCVDRDGATQEITESICLKDLGIMPTSVHDSQKKLTISLFRLSDSLFMRKREGSTSWYWYKKPRDVICCSETPMAFHWYKHPENLLKLDHILYGDSDYLHETYLSRNLSDMLLENPSQSVRPVITEHGRIPLFKYHREVEYLYRVRMNLASFRHILANPEDISSVY